MESEIFKVETESSKIRTILLRVGSNPQRASFEKGNSFFGYFDSFEIQLTDSMTNFDIRDL